MPMANHVLELMVTDRMTAALYSWAGPLCKNAPLSEIAESCWDFGCTDLTEQDLVSGERLRSEPKWQARLIHPFQV